MWRLLARKWVIFSKKSDVFGEKELLMFFFVCYKFWVKEGDISMSCFNIEIVKLVGKIHGYWKRTPSLRIFGRKYDIFWLEKCDVFKMIFCTESDVFKLKRRLYVSYGIWHNSSQIFDENVKFLRFKKTWCFATILELLS